MGWVCEVRYLGDSHNGEHVALAERKVLLGCAEEVVLGNTFCTGRPGGLQGSRQVGGCSRASPPTCPHLRGHRPWLAPPPTRTLGPLQLRFPAAPISRVLCLSAPWSSALLEARAGTEGWERIDLNPHSLFCSAPHGGGRDAHWPRARPRGTCIADIFSEDLASRVTGRLRCHLVPWGLWEEKD